MPTVTHPAEPFNHMATMQPTSESPAREWCDICNFEDIIANTGVCALLRGLQVAVVRVGDDQVYALSNFDPFSKAMVLARGIVGDRKGVPKIASPIYKHSFDLATGQCMDDLSVWVPVYAARVRDGRVEVAC